MPVNDNPEDTVQLEQLNEELSTSLERCHELVDGYRLMFAANSNEPDVTEEEAGARLG